VTGHQHGGTYMCPICGERMIVVVGVTDDMVARAVQAYYSVGALDCDADFENAMREALAAALEVPL